MINQFHPPDSNRWYNIKESPDGSHWVGRYNTTIDEIQKIFNDCGNSITKTIKILKQRLQQP